MAQAIAKVSLNIAIRCTDSQMQIQTPLFVQQRLMDMLIFLTLCSADESETT